jgi:hypothetical protein
MSAQRDVVWRHGLCLEPLELRNAPISLDLLSGLGGFGLVDLAAGISAGSASGVDSTATTSLVQSASNAGVAQEVIPAIVARAFLDAQAAVAQGASPEPATELQVPMAKLTPGQTDAPLVSPFESTAATTSAGALSVRSGATVASRPATGPTNAVAPGQRSQTTNIVNPVFTGAMVPAISSEQVAMLVGAQPEPTTATVSPAASEPQVAPDGFIAGQSATLEPNVAQGEILATPPVATPEQRAILDHEAAIEPLPTVPIPVDPNGAASNAPPTAPDLGSREPGDFTLYRHSADTSGGGLSPTGSPEVASVGRAFFETGNFYGSVSGDYGTNFSYVNPYTLFPASGDFSGGFGGNSRLATDLGRGMVMWQLEYVKTGSAANSTNGMRLAVANSATRLLDSTWTYYDLTPTFFGEGLGRWLNYAHLAVSSNYLYASSNEFQTTNNAYVRALLWRIPLSELQAGGTIHVTFWRVDNGSSLPLASNATSTMYSASHITTTSMRVFNQPESSTNLNWNDRTGLAATNTGTHTSLTVGNVNWTARSDERIQTGIVFQTTVTFLWNSAQGSGRPQPFIRGATFLTSNFNLTLQPDLWFGSYAWHWAGLAGSDQAGFGGPVFVGGPGLPPQVNILMQDEFANPTVPPPWTNYFAIAGNNASANWGDYVGAALDQRYTHTWLGGGYIQNGSSIVPYCFWFGRAGHDPHRLIPRAHSGETIATATDTGINQLGGFYDYSNELWSPAFGRRDVGMYHVHAYAGTTLYALTSTLSYAGGDDVDTYMRLFNSAGTELAHNDDISQTNLYSYLSYKITTTGDYYVGISGYPNSAYNPNVAGSGVPGAVGDYRMDILLLPNPTRAFRVTTTAANPDVAGTSFSVTVAALDADHNVNPSYRGTVHFATLDPQATIPGDYSFTAADNGVHTFTGVVLRRTGTDLISVNDNMFVAGATSPIVVIPAATTHFAVSGYPSTTAGTPGYVLVGAYDAYGNLTPLYRGQVHLSSTDPQAILPRDYTFTALDFGLHLFIAELRTAGTQSITVTDTADASITGTQSGIVITPLAANHFQIDAPSSVVSGTAFDVTVTALDRFGNIDTNYAGTVTFTTSDGDPNVVLPMDYPFAAGDQGVHTFSGGATLITEGDQTITATDVDSGIAGTATVTVTTSDIGNSSGLAGVALASLPEESVLSEPSSPDQSPSSAEMLTPVAWDGGILQPTVAKTTTADYRRTNLPHEPDDVALLDQCFAQLT